MGDPTKTATAHDPRRVFLSGPPGSGKSTVGRALADVMGCPFVDLDAHVEARAGKPVARIFAEDGEPNFRAMEREASLHLSMERGPRVIALGGGTVANDETRRTLIARGSLIGLDAQPDVLAARARTQTERPLLAGDVDARLAAILDARRDAYAERAAVVRTDHGDVASCVREVLDVVARDPIVVALGARTYVVEIGRAMAERIDATIAAIGPTATVMVCDTHTFALAEPRFVKAQSAYEGARAALVTLPPGEAHKTAISVARIWEQALAVGVDRKSVVVAIGGGVIGDLAGFAAATLLRGIRWVAVPTTLLAMVDASVGGKTGFDHAGGKNLVGAFHQPSAVVIDLDALATLPDRDVRAGLAEVVKMGLVVGEDALAAIEEDADALAAREPAAVERALRMAVRAKAEIVSLDERETRGLRDVLNVGHTLGHAFEAAAGLGDALLHGEAVALGTIAELRAFSDEPDGPSRALAERVATVLGRLGLGTNYGSRLIPELSSHLQRDKKRDGSDLRVPCVCEPGRIVTKRLAAEALLRRARENL